jgi:hypothetical protein
MTAPNPLASFPVPTVAEQYRMGPLLTDSPSSDYWWNYQWPDGTYTACGEPEGWESIDYITPLDQVGGRDGALVGPQSVAPRMLECEALIVSPSADLLRQHLARIRALFGPQGLPGPRQPVVWEQHDFGTARRLALITRPTGKLSMRAVPGVVEGGLAAVVTFTLVAANPPWKYQAGAVEFGQIGLLNPALVSGRTYDKTYSYTYGASGPLGGEMVVINQGDLAAFPVFYVTGPVDFPIITNATTGQEFQVNRSMAAGEQVIIDSRIGTVTPGSVRLIGRPFPLAPGANTIRWRSASGTYQPAALLRLEWRSTSR